MENKLTNYASWPNQLILVSHRLLAILALLFIVFYLMQGYYIRPAYDDLYFISLVQQNGFWGSMHEMYFHWSGRWTGFAMYFLSLKLANGFNGFHSVAFVYYVATMAVFVYSIFGIIKPLFIYLKVELDRALILIYSILFIACFYFFTFQNIEVWGWVCGNVFYLQSLALLSAGTALIMKKKRKIIHDFLLSISFVFVGGNNEIASLITGLLLVAVIVCFGYQSKFKILGFKNSPTFKGLLIALFSLCISSVISFSAPGNIERRGEHQTPTHVNQDSSSSILMTNVILQKKTYVAIGLAALFLILGRRLRRERKIKIDKRIFRKSILIFGVFIFLSLLVLYLFKLLLIDAVLPLRAYTFTSLILAVFFCLIFLYIGYLIVCNYHVLVIIIELVLPFAVVVLLTTHTYKQYGLASNYAKTYDNTINTIKEGVLKERKEVLYLNRISDAGTLLTIDLRDTNLTMEPLKSILGVKFGIEIIEPQKSPSNYGRTSHE